MSDDASRRAEVEACGAGATACAPVRKVDIRDLDEEAVVLASFSVTPLGGDDSVGDVVAGCVRIVRESGLPNETSAMFTTVEGSPSEVFALLQRCIEYAERHAPRVSVVAKLDHRPGHEGALRAKVDRVEQALAHGADPS